jgi:redox-sensitive bicupin YhaK (pirin superfamily)
MQPIKLDRGTKRGDRLGRFVVEILHPGLALTANDSGIGRIDRARVRPGHVIKMHPHRDDEILTYIRAGEILHSDTVGDEEEITKAPS